MGTIEKLRSFAKSNMSPSCFRNYEMFIEPTIKDWLFNPIDDWREVESNITQMVMITEKVFKGKIHFLYFDEGLYLFRWDKIPIRDNWRLIKFLKRNYNIDWVKTAKIEKINADKTIKLSTEKNSLSLRLENTKVSLKIDDDRTDEFIVKMNGKRIEIYKEDKEGSNEAGEEIDKGAFQNIKLFWGFTKKIDYLYHKGILKDFSHRVLDEANEVRNKIHDPSIVDPFYEQDLTLFHIARVITDNILIATRDDFGETRSANIKYDVEKFAEECLLKLNYE
ncbi:MAG: hypothetical protein J5U19_09930 [Candidatus Methanoperedens sp.]|nr:hypothetical protein [Candidatus Methanoperedens sp.]